MLTALLQPVLGSAQTRQVQQTVVINAAFKEAADEVVSRDLLAQALALVLFQQLLDRVPTGRAYVDDRSSHGHKVMFDHGAVRTVAWPCGALPRGEAAISRVLRPLGYAMAAVYPLPRLGMTGRAWRHRNWPQDLPQFFVSEFHPERFSSSLQAAVDRVVGASTDPLRPDDVAALEQLDRDGQLPLAQATALLPQLVACFDRQHAEPHWADYQALLAESPEMAWISTEGNAFNHATDRVADLAALAQVQRDLGRPIKDRIEVSASGRVQQTAFRADPVRRRFVGDAGWVEHDVPGSFYEFIQRAHLPAESGEPTALDLVFDAGNATGIFGMTAAVQAP
jgi:hypothetical protein